VVHATSPRMAGLVGGAFRSFYIDLIDFGPKLNQTNLVLLHWPADVNVSHDCKYEGDTGANVGSP